jgi:hypothetical protein
MENVVVSSPPMLIHTQDGHDGMRSEESWTIENEMLLRHWSTKWGVLEDAHKAASIFKKHVYYMTTIPTIIIPLATVPLTTSEVNFECMNLAITIALITTAILSGISSVFRFDKQHIKHEHAAVRYADLVSEVEEILSKRRKFRPEVDMTVSKLKTRSDALYLYSPPVSVYVCEGGESLPVPV